MIKSKRDTGSGQRCYFVPNHTPAQITFHVMVKYLTDAKKMLFNVSTVDELSKRGQLTLGVQIFAERNFSDFCKFWSNMWKLISRNILKLWFAKVYSHKISFFSPEFFFCFENFSRPFWKVIFGKWNSFIKRGHSQGNMLICCDFSHVKV